MESHQRDAEIVEHYVRSMGKERRAVAFHDLPSSVPGSITVVEFAPPNEDYDWVYARIGMSNRPMPDPHVPARVGMERRVELILYANQAAEELPQALLRLALIPFLNHTTLDPGDTVVGFEQEGVIKGSPLTEMLITYPFFAPEGFKTIHHSDGSHTDILWAIPIHVTERLYSKEHGSRALLKLFNANETDTSDFWREPVA